MRIFEPIISQLEAIWLQKLLPKYEALAESERKILIIAAIVLPIIIFVFGIFLPILDNNKTLKQQVTDISVQADEAKKLAQQLQTQSGPANSDTTNLLGLVDKLARKTKVREFMTRLRPQPRMNGEEKLQTQIKNAPYPNAARFIVSLEKNGLTLSQLKIQSVSKGIVNVQASIAK